MSISVVGLGLDVDDLPESHAQTIDQAHILVGGQRQLDFFDDHPAEKLVLKAPLDAIIEEIGRRDNDNVEIVVLADGDPLFFGIGKRLVEAFGPDGIRVLPNVTAVQTAAARLKIPWQDVATVSLHGRSDLQPLFAALRAHDWVAVLTDATNIPAAIAQHLMDRGGEKRFKMWVFEDLETERERYEKYTLDEAAEKSFSRLNLVLIERCGKIGHPLRLGIPDEEYVSGNGVMTKRPVRAVSIASMELTTDSVVWDLGGGSGSVGIEASAVTTRGRVYIVEKNADRVQDIRANLRHFGALAVDVVHGHMPDCLGDLPEPDRIHIGGGLGRDNDVLREACRRLTPKGRLVVACVLFKTLMRTKEYLQTLGWPFGITLVQASASHELGLDLHLEAHNPVFILSAEKSV